MDERVVVARMIEILRQLSNLSIARLRTIAAEVSIDQAVDLANALVQLDGGRERTPWLRCLTVEWLFAAGRISECVEQARQLSDEQVPAQVSVSAQVAEILALAIGEPAAGVARAVDVLRRAQPETGSAAAVAAAAVLADACWDEGRLQDGLRWASRADEAAARIPSPYWRMYVRIGLANKLAAVGDLETADELCREIEQAHALVPCPGTVAAVALVRTRTLIHRGNWAKARRVMRDEQIVQVHSTGARMFLPPLLGCLAVADMYSGDTDGARSRLDDARGIQPPRTTIGDGVLSAQWAVLHDWVEVFVRQASDGAAAAIEFYETTFGTTPAKITRLFAQVSGSAAWIVRVSVHCGRPDVARQAAELAEELSRRNPDLSHLNLQAEHARSLLVGDVLGLVRAANLQSHRWARGRAAFDLAAAVDAATTSEPLVISEPPAPPTVVPADSDREDTSITVTTWAQLSDREQRIAQHVAQGLTNRQIATRSACSVHTVNYHLRSIFRKLGIRSRIEITHFLPPRRSPDPTQNLEPRLERSLPAGSAAPAGPPH